MMTRGIRIDKAARSSMAEKLLHAAQERKLYLNTVIGWEMNPDSPLQMRRFFIDEMGCTPRKNRKGTFSLDAEVLVEMRNVYPLLCPIIDAIIELRSIGTFLSNFVTSRLDFDGRMRSDYGIAATETFRFNSAKSVRDIGGNLQNVPKGDRAKTKFKMPNVRELFIPDDPTKEIFDIDLAGADAQVVAWEADDPILKELFRKKIKVHAVNAKDLFGGNAGPDGKKEPYYTRTKMGVHLTNYGGKPRTMAKALGIPVHEAEKFQTRWFEIHPWIRKWHEAVQRELDTYHRIRNIFGYERIYFGHNEYLLPQALAWKPQSTVAIVARKAQDIIEERFRLAEINMQVHDSLVFQLPILRPKGYVESLMEAINIVCPYEDPLIIPFGMKSSVRNWGECE